MSQPSEVFRVAEFPDAIVLEALPAHLRDNPIARLRQCWRRLAPILAPCIVCEAIIAAT